MFISFNLASLNVIVSKCFKTLYVVPKRKRQKTSRHHSSKCFVMLYVLSLLRFVTSMLCAATFSNNYVKWLLGYIMLRFVAVPIFVHHHLPPHIRTICVCRRECRERAVLPEPDSCRRPGDTTAAHSWTARYTRSRFPARDSCYGTKRYGYVYVNWPVNKWVGTGCLLSRGHQVVPDGHPHSC
jgi:hypothetical protein